MLTTTALPADRKSGELVATAGVTKTTCKINNHSDNSSEAPEIGAKRKRREDIGALEETKDGSTEIAIDIEDEHEEISNSADDGEAESEHGVNEAAPCATDGERRRARNKISLADTTAPSALGKPKRRNRPRLFFNPSDAFCHWWAGIVSLAFLYNFWSLSYRFAFREIDSSTVTIWFLFDYTADLIYLNDIWVNFRTGHLEDGVLQRDPKKIGAHYRESTLFYLDTLCLLPFDFLYLSFGYCSIMRCNKLVKIYKFWSFVDRTERHTNYPNVFRTFTLVHYILVIFHWNACLFHMISKHKIIDIESLYRINNNQCEDISCQYLHAFYWSTLALTLIGDLPRPRTRGEYIYVIVELVFGLFLFASVLGHVANIVTNVSAARKEFQAKLDAVKTFMRTRRVSDGLQNKVIRWFDYLWMSQKSSDEDRSVACLPDRLKAEIAIHVNLDTLKRVDIFQSTEAGFLCELVLRLKPVLFSPGDYVCRKNEVGHEMYIVSRGILEVVTNGGAKVVATFRAGSYFGEIAVLNVGLAGNKRTASVRSVGYSDLFCLSKSDLWDVLKDYPNAAARIKAVAEERLSMLGSGRVRSYAKGRRTSPANEQSAAACAADCSSRRQPGANSHGGLAASSSSPIYRASPRESNHRARPTEFSATGDEKEAAVWLHMGRGCGSGARRLAAWREPHLSAPNRVAPETSCYWPHAPATHGTPHPCHAHQCLSHPLAMLGPHSLHAFAAEHLSETTTRACRRIEHQCCSRQPALVESRLLAGLANLGRCSRSAMCERDEARPIDPKQAELSAERKGATLEHVVGCRFGSATTSRGALDTRGRQLLASAESLRAGAHSADQSPE